MRKGRCLRCQRSYQTLGAHGYQFLCPTCSAVRRIEDQQKETNQ